MSDEKLAKNKRPLSDNNETTKLNKRRQNIKESEQKRRERINEKFDQVTSLLHSSETLPRATKESILQEAIQRIKELQSRRVTPQTLSVSFPLQTPLFDKQEIEAGFHVLFKRESLKLQEIRSESQLASSRQSCSRIIELADLCDRDDYRLYAYMTAATFHQIVSYDPDEAMRFMDMATPFYKKIKEHQAPSLSYFGVDLGAWMEVCYAISLSSKGQFDRAMNHFDVALRIAKESSAFTLRRIYNGLRYIKYAAGETLSQADFNAVKSVNIQTPQSKFVVISHMLENKYYQSDAERRKMVADLEESITECAQTGGYISYSFFRSLSLPCFVDTNPDFGLEQARHLLSFMNKGITGMTSKCDLLRNMAILLISKGGSENRYEAKKTLEEAIRLSLKTGFIVSALRSLMDIMQLCDAGTPEYCDYLMELEDLADLIAKNSIKQRSSLVEKAKVVISKCRENCK